VNSPPGGVRLTMIYDNYSASEDLRPAWGFSCLVEGLDRTILFDTGGHGPTLMSNMEELGIAPESVGVVFLSHSHWDHVGGLPDFLSANNDVKVFMLRSFPARLKKAARDAGASVEEITDPAEIVPCAASTGEMVTGRGTPEHSLMIRSEAGVVVLTGCAHPGVVSIAERAAKLTGQSILAVVGGYHLHGAGDGRVREAVSRLSELGVAHVAPCHCTGDRATELIRAAYGERCLSCAAGVVIDSASLPGTSR
jgi:7,8-dihydropterin-6-yl-methyl-4-(beta-D-ribofuranosyl)aminobenzene 5'-phosphate synthase